MNDPLDLASVTGAFTALSGALDRPLSEPVVDDFLRAAGLHELRPGAPADDVERAVRQLALQLGSADPVRREAVRADAINRLRAAGVRAPGRILDAALGVATRPQADRSGPVVVREDEPTAEPVDGAALADMLVQLLTHYVVLPQHGALAVALWAMHTYLMEVWSISPLLVVTSPTRRCGKTTLLQICFGLCYRALAASNITTPALFRMIEKYGPTILLDEYETFSRDDEALRGVVNAGHTRATAFVVRLVGDDHEPALFRTWAPKLISLIGRPGDTIVDRAIVVEMRRRTAVEAIARLRADRLEAVCAPLRRQLRRWAADHGDALREADPDMPDALHDRATDNWRPLVALADALGGDWPRLARDAAAALSTHASADEPAPVQLLADIRTVFRDEGDPEVLASSTLVERLLAVEGPWAEWRHGRPLTAAGLARLLRPYGVFPHGSTRVRGRVVRTYRRAAFADAWYRYLPFNPLQCCDANENGHQVANSDRYTDAGCSGLRSATTPNISERCSAVAGSDPVEDRWDRL